MSVIVSSRNSMTPNYHSLAVRRKGSGRNQEKRGKGAPAEAEAPDAPGAGGEEDAGKEQIRHVRRAFGEEGGEEGAVEQEQDSPKDAEGHVADADGERGAGRSKDGGKDEEECREAGKDGGEGPSVAEPQGVGDRVPWEGTVDERAQAGQRGQEEAGRSGVAAPRQGFAAVGAERQALRDAALAGRAGDGPA